MIEKKVLLIDMDGVIVDFEKGIKIYFEKYPEERKYYKGNPDEIDGIFRDLPPIDGAIESVKKLYDCGKYDIFIATTASWENETCGADKRIWIEEYFGDLFKKKMFITHRKDMLIGDILIDDRLANGAEDFKGELLPFGWSYERKEFNKYPTWDSILEKLL